MAFKPSDFSIGVLDFFSVILPGAILTAFILPLGFVTEGMASAIKLDGAATWVAFALASYLVGHLIFMVGARLDRRLYDRWRRWKHPLSDDTLYECAKSIRNQALDLGRPTSQGPSPKDPINVFQWAKTICTLRSPRAAQDVERLEADSKFFRSLVIVFPIVAAVLFWNRAPVLATILLGLTLACFARYAERRWKSTEVAYQYLVALPYAELDQVDQRKSRRTGTED